MKRACAYERREMRSKVGLKTFKRRDYSGYIHVDGRIILKQSLNTPNMRG
jgi:hypothetical protein